MTHPTPKLESRENNAAVPSSNEAQANAVDSSLENAMVSGEIAEVAKTQAAQNAHGAKGTDDDSSTQKKDEERLPERELLKRRLLSQAPSQGKMKRQTQSILEKERDQLEADVRKYRRKKDYHMLSKALLKLRRVVHQLQILARASAEALQELWLKVVHKFA